MKRAAAFWSRNITSVSCILCLAAFTAGPRILSGQTKPVALLSTANLDKKLETHPVLAGSSASPADAVIRIDEQQGRQAITGFGGTFTESTAYNLRRLSAAKRKEILNAFFHPDSGAGWTLLRTTINSCDAASMYYSYDETPGDTLLKQFSIQKDVDNFMIPTLQQAQDIPGASFKIFASPWTPPVWMKNTRKHNIGYLLPQYYKTWALYFSKYISGYKQQGISISAVTPQNEPMAYQQAWDACGWTASQMNLFIKDHLGPELQKQFKDSVAIWAYDHNKKNMLAWMDTLTADPQTAEYIDGITYHWYEEGEGKQFAPVLEAYKKYPGKPIIASEQGVFGLHLRDGNTAELYARDIIGNMNNGSSGWIIWGMAYDSEGKPNHAGNFAHSPVMVDMKTQGVIYNPSYYYLAHFSKFIKPGAINIPASSSDGNVLAAAFKTAENTPVTVVMNQANTAKRVKLLVRGKNYRLALPAHSIATVLF